MQVWPCSSFHRKDLSRSQRLETYQPLQRLCCCQPQGPLWQVSTWAHMLGTTPPWKLTCGMVGYDTNAKFALVGNGQRGEWSQPSRFLAIQCTVVACSMRILSRLCRGVCTAVQASIACFPTASSWEIGPRGDQHVFRMSNHHKWWVSDREGMLGGLLLRAWKLSAPNNFCLDRWKQLPVKKYAVVCKSHMQKTTQRGAS